MSLPVHNSYSTTNVHNDVNNKFTSTVQQNVYYEPNIYSNVPKSEGSAQDVFLQYATNKTNNRYNLTEFLNKLSFNTWSKYSPTFSVKNDAFSSVDKAYNRFLGWVVLSGKREAGAQAFPADVLPDNSLLSHYHRAYR